MSKIANRELLRTYWKELYPESTLEKLDIFLKELPSGESPIEIIITDWYKDAIVYALYVNLFNTDFNGLTEKLDYLQQLGVNCLWLLPILDSPMRDAGFDIKKYDRIRPTLLGLSDDSTKEEQEVVFGDFLKEAHSKGIRVIFDIAINHSSDQHPWFLESQKSEDNPYRDYYIWSKDNTLYGDARLLFKGIEDSNWEPLGDSNYFHRFFSFQPDLNYRNPEVLLAMSKNLLYWQKMGVDGFRADAIPYLWKEVGTNCENLPETHVIVKFFRAILDYVKPGSLLLAEACQKPNEVVKYMGDGDECHAAYHFPLMPMMFKSIAQGDGRPIKQTLSPSVTPVIPVNSQWLSFLRVHDELSLELVYVSEEDRKFIHDNYCLRPEWNFRVGEGISARLAELMQQDEHKIALAYSLMLTITGTPVVYYGDEFGKLNDNSYYQEQIKLTGKDDTRFLVRGRIDWDQLAENLKDEENFHSRIFELISNMLNIRKDEKAFGRGETNFQDVVTLDGEPTEKALAYTRQYEDETLLVINNLSAESLSIQNPFPDSNLMLLFPQGLTVGDDNNSLNFDAYGFAWMRII